MPNTSGWAAVGFARRHPPLPPARQQGAGASRVPLGVGRRDHHRPARAGRCDQRGHGHRREMARRPLQPAGLRDLRLQHLCGLRRRLPDGRRRVGSGLARRPPRPGQPLLDLRQQPHHDRRQHATSPSPRTSRRGSWPTAGTSCASATPTTSTASSRRWTVFRKTKGRPTFIILDSHIGYGSPHKQDTAAAHGEPLGEEEVRLTKRAYGWPEDAKFLVPDGVREHFAAGIGARGAQAHRRVDRAVRGLPRASIRSSRPRSTRCSGASCRPAGTADLPVFPADPKGIAGRDASGKVLNVLAQNIPWLLGGSADLGPSNKTTLTFEGRRRLPGRQPRRQEPAFRHPRARDGGHRQRARRCRSCGPSAPRSSSSATTRGRRSGCPR